MPAVGSSVGNAYLEAAEAARFHRGNLTIQFVVRNRRPEPPPGIIGRASAGGC